MNKRLTKPFCKSFETSAKEEIIRIGGIKDRSKSHFYTGGIFKLETPTFGTVYISVDALPRNICSHIRIKFDNKSLAKSMGLSDFDHRFYYDDIESGIEHNCLNKVIANRLLLIDPEFKKDFELLKRLRNCVLSGDESSLLMIAVNGPMMTNGSDTGISLRERCTRINETIQEVDRHISSKELNNKVTVNE